MGNATHQLTRLLPGESSDELKPSGPIPAGEALRFRPPVTTSITQYIFPSHQFQDLFTLSRGLRDILENRNTEKHDEIIESLEFIHSIFFFFFELGVYCPLHKQQDMMVQLSVTS